MTYQEFKLSLFILGLALYLAYVIYEYKKLERKYLALSIERYKEARDE